MLIIRLVLALALIIASFAIMAVGIAFVFTLVLAPVGLAIISAGATVFAFGAALAGGTQ